MQHTQFQCTDVEQAFDAYPNDISGKLLAVRELIFQAAESEEIIGAIDETLKWGEPSYLTHRPKSGTTIRLSNVKSNTDQFALSVHCQTTLIAEFKENYPELIYDGNRRILFNAKDNLPREQIQRFIYLALTYHYRKKRGIGV